jgi:hypothetical protein
MFPFWLFIGVVTILFGLLNRRLLRLLGLKPMSETFTIPNLQRSFRTIEQIGRLLLITLGTGFLVQGLGEQLLSGEITYRISLSLLGLSGLMILAMIGITIANWKAK